MPLGEGAVSYKRGTPVIELGLDHFGKGSLGTAKRCFKWKVAPFQEAQDVDVSIYTPRGLFVRPP